MDAAGLIGIRSTADRPEELGRALDFVLGVVGDGYPVRRFHSRGKPSALVGRPGPYEIILNAHVDVVPGEDAQFVARRDGDRLYGRGAHDMKVAALVLAEVFRDNAARLPYPIALQLVTDEEVGGEDGTAHQLGQGVSARFAIVGEQSALRIVNESRGLCHARIETDGRTAHAAYPWLGDNALTALHRAIGRILEKYPEPAAERWQTTVNLARIETPNSAINQVPAAATAWLDIRFPPDDPDLAGRTATEVANYLTNLAGSGTQDGAARSLSRVGVTVDSLGAPHRADPETRHVRLLREAVREAGYPGELLRKFGAADSRHFSAHGIPAVILGPGGDGQHGSDEYADLGTIAPYRAALTSFLWSLADPA